jgi:hypothetical protein
MVGYTRIIPAVLLLALSTACEELFTLAVDEIEDELDDFECAALNPWVEAVVDYQSALVEANSGPLSLLSPAEIVQVNALSAEARATISLVQAGVFQEQCDPPFIEGQTQILEDTTDDIRALLELPPP